MIPVASKQGQAYWESSVNSLQILVVEVEAQEDAISMEAESTQDVSYPGQQNTSI